jgi:dihydroorotase-like cyclic amidohydrolase
MVAMQLVMGVLVICISTASLHRFYTTDHLLPGLDDSARCSKFHTAGADGYASRGANCCFHGRTLQGRVELTVARGSVAFSRAVAGAIA